MALILVTTSAASTHAQTGAIAWQHDIQAALSQAKESKRLVLVHFWAPWCGPCMKLEHSVFNQASVGETVSQNYIPVKINASETQQVAKQYNITALPTDMILAPDGKILAKFVSPPTARAYSARMTQVAALGQKDAVTQVAAAGMAPINRGNHPSVPAQQQGTLAAGNSRDGITQTSAHGPTAQTAPGQAGSGQAAPGQSPAGDRYDQGSQNPVAQANPYAAPSAGGAAPAVGGSSSQNPQSVQPGNPYAAALANQSPPTAAPHGGMTAQGGLAPAYQGAAANGMPQQRPAPPYGPGRQAPGVQGGMALQNGANMAQSAAGVLAGRPQHVRSPSMPAFGLEGYCCVSLVEEQRWVLGDRRWGAVHRGVTYLFAGPDQQKRFLKNPDLYAPVLGGNDPIVVLEQRQFIPGQRRHGVYYRDHVYLFSSEKTLQQFERSPEHYVQGVQQAMQQNGSGQR